MSSNWQTSIDLAADAGLKDSRTWKKARVFIYATTIAPVIYRAR